MHIEIENRLPLSLNKLLRAHYKKRSKLNHVWKLILSRELEKKTLPVEPLPKARIRFVRHAHRTLDFDGLVGSMKPVMDALIELGVVKDDSWNVTGPWSVEQKFRPQKSGTLLEIFVWSEET